MTWRICSMAKATLNRKPASSFTSLVCARVCVYVRQRERERERETETETETETDRQTDRQTCIGANRDKKYIKNQSMTYRIVLRLFKHKQCSSLYAFSKAAIRHCAPFILQCPLTVLSAFKTQQYVPSSETDGGLERL